jgi:hypothetical protein
MKAKQRNEHHRRAVAGRHMLRRLELGAGTLLFVIAYQWSFRLMLLAKRWNY